MMKISRTFIKKTRSATIVALLSLSIGVMFGAAMQKHSGFDGVLKIVDPRMFVEQPPYPAPIAETSYDIPKEFQGRLSLFVLAGQSNMSGKGEIPSEQSANPRIIVFGNDYHWRIASEPIDSPNGQLDEVSLDSNAGFGPGLAFATSLIKRKPDMVIGIIPCAKSASSIEEWQRSLSDNSLYGSCLKRIRAATTMGELAGLLFFQGEADAVDPNQSEGQPVSAHDYGNKFSSFVTDLRGDVSLRSLPVVFAQIGMNTAPEYFINWNAVKAQQAQVKLSCSSMITTDDLALRDAVHFTNESYQLIGERFADAFWNLMTRSQIC